MENSTSYGKMMAVFMVTAFAFLLATELPAFAQGGARPSSIQRRVEQLNRQGEQYERDNVGREVSGTKEKNDRTHARALELQIKKDLEALQAGYNQIVVAMAAKKTLADDQILDAVATIKECSHRLRDNLALPRANDDKKETELVRASEKPKQSLLALRKVIYNFVMNPLFDAPAVLDVEQAKKASRDLDQIIELSENITKHQPRAKKATR